MPHKDELQRQDMRIVGNGGSAGGYLGKLNIMGDGEIHGNTDALKFKCTGNAVVHGNLKTESLKLTGELIVNGSLEGDTFSTMGKLEVQKYVAARKVKFSGETIIDEQITCEEIEMTGYNTVTGGCQAEDFKLRGALYTAGMLNSEKVEMKLLGESRINEIGGGQIRVIPSTGVWNRLGMFGPGGGPARLMAGSIEGDVIELENTEAAVVRGNKVKIGPGCKIGLVEYIEAFHQDRSSTVDQLNQIGSMG